jgi:hypothetical protein
MFEEVNSTIRGTKSELFYFTTKMAEFDVPGGGQEDDVTLPRGK